MVRLPPDQCTVGISQSNQRFYCNEHHAVSLKPPPTVHFRFASWQMGFPLLYEDERASRQYLSGYRSIVYHCQQQQHQPLLQILSMMVSSVGMCALMQPTTHPHQITTRKGVSLLMTQEVPLRKRHERTQLLIGRVSVRKRDTTGL